VTWEPGDKVRVHGLDQAFVVAAWLAPDLTDCFCDRPGDRLYHAADDTWWRREGDQLVPAEPPSGWIPRGSEPWLGKAP
jgi:hypothetical protein